MNRSEEFGLAGPRQEKRGIWVGRAGPGLVDKSEELGWAGLAQGQSIKVGDLDEGWPRAFR